MEKSVPQYESASKNFRVSAINGSNGSNSSRRCKGGKVDVGESIHAGQMPQTNTLSRSAHARVYAVSRVKSQAMRATKATNRCRPTYLG